MRYEVGMPKELLKIPIDSYEEDEVRPTRAHETVQGLVGLVSMILQNDGVQDYDVRWDHALSSVSEMLSDPILEGFYKSKLRNSAEFRIVMAMYDQEVVRSNGTPNYHHLQTAVKLHIDQMMRNRSFRVWSDVVERGSVTKVKKRNKVCVAMKIVFSAM